MCTHVGLLQQLCPLSHTSCAWFEIGALTEWEFRSLFPATLLELTEDDDQHFSKDGMHCTLTHTYLIKEILAFCLKTTGKSGSNTSWAMEQWSNFPYCHLLSLDVFLPLWHHHGISATSRNHLVHPHRTRNQQPVDGKNLTHLRAWKNILEIALWK